MMSHINKGDVHAFLDGALSAYPEEEASHVRKHLDECPECARLLEDEKRLREEASRILAGSVVRPFELDPLEELQARAATLDGQVGAQQVEGAGRAEGSGQKGMARPTLVSRMYSLRWAATIVVSLGAGWMARGLNGPDLNGARGSLTEPVSTESAAPPVAREFDARASANQELQESNERGNAGRLAEAETPLESSGAVVGGAVGSDSDRGAGGFDADAVLDQDDAVRDQVGAALDRADAAPDRQRAASRVARGVGPADANVGGQPAEPRVEALSLSDELRDPAPAAALQDGASLFNDAPASSADASLATTALMVPGLPVRDVRVAPNAAGLAAGPTEGLRGIVIVTQELGDGRLIELEFVPVAENDSVGLRTFQERREPQGGTQRAGWSVVVRDVPGGVAFLSGPLTELELAELLDRALGLR